VSHTSKRSTTGRFGSRYGTSVRKGIAQTEAESKRKHECPKCANVAVKRVSVGVWRCGECGNTFAGGAYAPVTKVGTVARRSIRQG
jgi:large subunit ribosomal protein L37Ae